MAKRTTRIKDALQKERLDADIIRIIVFNVDTNEIVTDLDDTWTGSCPAYNKTALGENDRVSRFLNRLSIYKHNHEELTIEYLENGTWTKVNGNKLMRTLREHSSKK